MHDIVTFIAHHAIWAGPIMFIVAFGESFAFVSLLFPGTAMMIAAGGFIPGGTLDAWPLLIGCASGAILGDAVSYYVGRRYGHLVERSWPLSRYPEALTKGFAFFERHGGKSVFVGRFFGPLRAVIPLVAGIARMAPSRFWLANIPSALAWAPILLLPGVLTVWALHALHTAQDWRLWIAAASIGIAGIGIWLALRHQLLDRLLRKS